MNKKILVFSILVIGLVFISSVSAYTLFPHYKLDKAKPSFIPDVTYSNTYLDKDHEDCRDNEDDECNQTPEPPEENKTDIIFQQLQYSYGDILGGEAVFIIKNIFNQDIPLLVDYYNYNGYITQDTYYLEKTFLTPISVMPNSTNTTPSPKQIKKWVKTTTIPANYNGRIKIIAKYNNIAYDQDYKVIEWIPRLVVNNQPYGSIGHLFKNLFPSLFATTYEQTKWDWFNASWQSRNELNINSSKIDTDLTNFTVLVKLNSTNVNFTDIAPDGKDIRFTNIGNTITYDFEIEKFNATSQEAYIWVQIPSVSNSTATGFFIYYNNPTVATYGNSTGEAVWGSNWDIVVHLKENSGTIKDSSQFNASLTPQNSPNLNVNMVIDGAVSLDGINDYVSMVGGSSGVPVGNSDDYTICGWLNSTNVEQTTIEYALINVGSAGNRYALGFKGNQSYYHNGATVMTSNLATSPIHDNTTYFICARRQNSSSTSSIIINGTFKTTGTTNTADTVNNNFDIGRQTTGDTYQGFADEIRKHKFALTDAQIKAEYFSQSNNLIIFGLTQGFPLISLISPINNTITNNQIVTHTFSYSSNNTSSTTCWLNYNGTQIASITNVLNNTSTSITPSAQPVAQYGWTINCDLGGQNVTSNEEWNLLITNENISVVLPQPNGSITSRFNVPVNASITDNLTNSFNCFYSDTIDGTINQSVSCNTTTINLTNIGTGNFTFLAKPTNIADTRIGTATNTIIVDTSQFFKVNAINGTPIAQENFTLTFNNETDTFSQTNINNTTMIISLSSLPTGNTNITVRAKSLGEGVFNQTIDTFSEINRTLTLNQSEIIIKTFDEQTNAQINFNLSLSNTTNTQTFNNQLNFQSLSENTLSGSITATISSTGYQQRTFFYTIDDFTRVTLNASLLNTTQGIIVRFHIVNGAGQVIPNALVVAQKNINGTYQTIEQGITDTTGTTTFFLDPLITYKIITTFGSLSDISFIQPTSNDFTIILGSAEPTEIINTLEGIGFSMTPTTSVLTFNNTTGIANINWSVVASLSDLSYFGLKLEFNNTTIFFLNNTTGNSGGKIIALINLTGASFGDTVNATGFFQRTGFSEFEFKKTYTIRNSSFSGTSLIGIFNLLDTSGTGLSDGSKGLLALLIAGFGSAMVGTVIGIGSIFLGIGILGIFAFVGWFPSGLYLLIVISIIAGYSLLRRG